MHMAARFNGPVYLLGSILHNPAPRDVDVRIVVHDHEFAARYGMEMKPCDQPATDDLPGRTAKVFWDEDGPTQTWVDDMAKLGGAMSAALGINLDVKVWPESYFRLRIYPKPVVLAAPSPHWFVYNAHVPDPSLPAKAAVDPTLTPASTPEDPK